MRKQVSNVNVQVFMFHSFVELLGVRGLMFDCADLGKDGNPPTTEDAFYVHDVRPPCTFSS
jgi:hypothetical protein